MKRQVLASLLLLALMFTLLPTATLAADPEHTYDAPSTAQDATGVTAKKELTDNGDGTYTITLSVQGYTDTSTTTQDLPADVVLVVDTSGSMAEDVYASYAPCNGQVIRMDHRKYCSNNKNHDVRDKKVGDTCDVMVGAGESLGTRMSLAKAATKSFVESLLAQDSVQIGLADFSGSNYADYYGDRTHVSIPLTDRTDTLNAGIDSLSDAHYDGTNYAKGLTQAKTILDASTRNVQKFIIFISDGEPNAGLTDDDEVASKLKTEDNVVIFSVGIDVGSGSDAESALRAIASDKGENEKHCYITSSDALESILAELVHTIQSSVYAGTNAVMTDVINTNDFDVVTQASGEGVAVDGSTITWTIGSIGAESQSISFTVRPKEGKYGALYTNTNVALTFHSSKLDQDVAFQKGAIGDPNIYVKAPDYTVTWVDDDGETVLGTGTFAYGTSAKDVEAKAPADPAKESTAEHSYTFAGWTPEYEQVTGNKRHIRRPTPAVRTTTP